MKDKQLKEEISRLYYAGISDGIDITNRSRDRFFGDKKAREGWEKDILDKAYKNIKKLI